VSEIEDFHIKARFQGFKVSKFQGFKVSGCKVFKVSRPDVGV
jgi:hypothetical protein